MKRLLCCLLALLCLCGCADKSASVMKQPVTFYYRTASTEYGTDQGLIRAETRDLGDRELSLRDIFEQYFAGPEDVSLKLSLPADISLDNALPSTEQPDRLELRLKADAKVSSNVDMSIAYACIAKTAFELKYPPEDPYVFNSVQIIITSRAKGIVLQPEPITLDRDSIMLYDDGNPSGTSEFTLYFADNADRFLLPEWHSFSYTEESTLEQYARDIVKQLIKGPDNPKASATLPEGTDLIDVEVDGGLCSIDFNGDFRNNRPSDSSPIRKEQKERLVLLSVVNSLCALDGIDRVQFYVEGESGRYVYLDLSSPFSFESSAIGPIRQELEEFEGTLCLPDREDGSLHRFLSRIRKNVSQSKAEALIRALFDYSSQNGVVNYFSSNTPIPVVTGSLIAFPADPFPAEEPARTNAIRSLVATLTATQGTGISALQITVNGEPITLPEFASEEYPDAQEQPDDGFLSPSEDWFRTAREDSPAAFVNTEPLPGDAQSGSVTAPDENAAS